MLSTKQCYASVLPDIPIISDWRLGGKAVPLHCNEYRSHIDRPPDSLCRYGIRVFLCFLYEEGNPESPAESATGICFGRDGCRLRVVAAYPLYGNGVRECLAVTIHNFPEGMAVGVAIAGAMTSGFSIAGALVLLLASAVTPLMPYLLAFAAGAMLYVVIEELIPETAEGKHSNLGTIGFALGFALMMVLDVVMG